MNQTMQRKSLFEKRGHLTLAIQAIFENEISVYDLSKTACLKKLR